MNNNPVGSTAFKKIDHILKPYECYQQFMAKEISRKDYLAQLLVHKKQLLAQGLNEDQIHLSSRFALDCDAVVDNILAELFQAKVIPTTVYPIAAFHDYYCLVEESFQHEHYTTYIFPEEAQLLFALTHILQPKTMMFLGSYYGYWAIWAMPALQENGGEAYLIDIDAKVLELSKKNMQHFDIDQRLHYVCGDAIEFCKQEKIQHDFIVLDAEGPKVGPDPDMLDKAIYYPMLNAADEFLSPTGTILFHNILLNNPIVDAYFADKIQTNYRQFDKLIPYIRDNYRNWSCYDTTEGVGVLRFKDGASI